MVIMKKRSSFDVEIGAGMEMGSNIDLSLLRRPLTPFTGFQEAKSAFDKGTVEVRHLLLHECSLIYECNICRNMFRSLANFLMHKRVFCCNSALKRNKSHDATNGTTESRKCNAARKCVPPKSSTELKPNCMQTRDNEADDETTTKKALGPNLESNEEEKCGVKNDDISATAQNANHAIDLIDGPTEKNLEKIKDQSGPAFVFECPSCSLTFLKSSSVIRHLALTHNIPLRHIRMMRDTIIKRPANNSLANGESLRETKPQTQLNALLFGNEASAQKTTTAATTSTATVDFRNSAAKTTDHDDDLTKCVFCQKSFERRAILSAHLQTCHIKLEMVEETTSKSTTKPSSSRIPTTAKELQLIKEEPKHQIAAIAADVDCVLNDDDDEHGDEHEFEDDVNQTFVQLEQKDFGLGLQTLSLDKLELSASESTSTSLALEKETNENKDVSTLSLSSSPSPSASAKKRKIRTNCALKQSCRCKICGKQFNALSNLRRHISMFHYRSRKYGCALCDYCAFRRYDITNHLSFVHKMNGGEENAEELGKFVRVNDVPYTKDDMEEDIVLLCVNDGQEVLDGNNDLHNNSNNNEDEKQHAELTIANEPQKKRRRRNKSPLSGHLAGKATKIEGNVNTGTTAEVMDTVDKSLQSTTVMSNEIKLTRQMLRRSLSQQTINNNSKAHQKRPTRNRFKTESKDFVYDLQQAPLSKNQTLTSSSPVTTMTTTSPIETTVTTTYQLRGASKRRNTLNVAAQQQHQNSAPIKQRILASFDNLKTKNFVKIKGAARRSCLLKVSMSLAASSTLPEIPSERPQMRSRLFSMQQRSDSQITASIIDSTEIDAERLKSLPLCDDSYLEKIAKDVVGSFEMKPCLAPHHSAFDTLLQKFDTTNNFTNSLLNRIKCSGEDVEMSFLNNGNAASTPTTTAAISEIEPFFITPEQAITKAFVTPAKPQKRLPSLDRLTEAISSSSSSETNVVGFYNAPIFEE